MKDRGINAHVPSKSDIDKVVACGCEWIRIDLDWRFIEPSKNAFKWSLYDTAISYSKQNGLKIYATLAYVPAWINKDSRKCPDKKSWIEFCTIAAKRYVGKVDIFSLWNEPNLKDFFKGSQKDYINKILIPGYQAIKAVNKSIVVAGGDLSTASKSSWTSWFSLLKKNAKYFDVFAWHVYDSSANSVISRFKLGKIPIVGWIVPKWRPFKWYISGIKKKGKRIFLTETGLKARANKSKELSNQENFVKNISKIAKETKSEIVFIYDLKDSPLQKDKWGIFDDKVNPKKSAKWLMNHK